MSGGILMRKSGVFAVISVIHEWGRSKSMVRVFIKATCVLGIAAIISIAWLIIYTNYLMKKYQKMSHSITIKIPLRSYAGDYYVKVCIQGKEGWMLLDTGSSTTLLIKTTLGDLRYSPLQTGETVFFPFADKTLVTTKVEVPNVEIGSWHIPRLTTLMTNQPQLVLGKIRNIDGLSVFGILGYDLLRQWRMVSLDHYALILQQQLIVLPAEARIFCLHEIGGRPAICKQTARTQPVLWVIDTGCENHLVRDDVIGRLTARVRTYQHGGELVAPLALVVLQDKRGQALTFPAAIKPVGSPPFTRSDYEGLLGNALLQRYRIVFDHFNQRVWFVPLDSTPSKGTYGLLLFADRRQSKLYAHFVIPQVSGLPNDFVRIVSVDGVLVKGWDESLANRLLYSRVGSSVYLNVELPNKRRQQVVCYAYAPDEAGLQLFQAYTRIGSRQLYHTVIRFREGRFWLYPFNVWRFRRQSVPDLVLVREDEGMERSLGQIIAKRLPKNRIPSDRVMWEMVIKPVE
jgi:hypothetical protein